VAQRLRRHGLGAVAPEVEASLTRLAVALRVSRPVRLLESALVEVPTCIGWLRPLILLPASTLAGLSMQQLELLLAHELAHVRRRDYLVNLLQAAAETLLFYHPAVWWVSHRMRVEREHCCDDLAVAACGDALGYARALATLEERRSPAPALAMAADGASLVARVRRLAGLSHEARSARAPALGATVLLTAAAGAGSLLLAGSMISSPWSAFALDTSPEEWTRDTAQAGQASGVEEDEETGAKPDRDAEQRGFSLSLILEMARQGVTPEYIDEMADLGYPSLTPEQLIELRSQGVDSDYVRELADVGYRDLSTEQLVELRSQGVDAEFARGLKEQGLDSLSLADLVQLRNQGVDPEYIAELKEAGQENLSVSRLISLRNQGVDGEFVTELKAQGYDGLSANRLIALRSMGVTPDYVRELASLGYRGIEVPLLIGLRSEGVSAEYVRDLQEAGYSKLPAGALIELRSAGVSPEYVRELKDAGVEGLSVEELIELRSQGVDPELIRRFKGRR
jgi:hypothetical protein